jgi:hypothetical protein
MCPLIFEVFACDIFVIAMHHCAQRSQACGSGN